MADPQPGAIGLPPLSGAQIRTLGLESFSVGGWCGLGVKCAANDLYLRGLVTRSAIASGGDPCAELHYEVTVGGRAAWLAAKQP
jgi:hypothetical protein